MTKNYKNKNILDEIKPVLVEVIKPCKSCGYKNATNFTYCCDCGCYLLNQHL